MPQPQHPPINPPKGMLATMMARAQNPCLMDERIHPSSRNNTMNNTRPSIGGLPQKADRVQHPASRLVAIGDGNRASGFDHGFLGRARYLRRRLGAIHDVDTRIPVPFENRTSELTVSIQPVADDGFLIVLAGEQPRSEERRV